MAQQQEQLGQRNEQMLGREHALGHEGCMVLHGVVASSAGSIVRDDWRQHCQQLCHRLEDALFSAAALVISFEAMLHLGRDRKMNGPRF